jgi:tetratricopeptide (TPR) repeat protein
MLKAAGRIKLTESYALTASESSARKGQNQKNRKGDNNSIMQNPKNQSNQQSDVCSKVKTMKREEFVMAFFLMLFLAATIIFPNLSYGSEKKIKKQPVQKEAAAITGSTVQASFAKAEELLKKGDSENSLRIFIKVYDYTKEALATIIFVQKQYETIIKDPATDQNEKEDIFIKLNRMKQLVPKYSSIKTATAYNMGYIYAKRGESDKARKYLSEVLEATPFSTKQSSLWMKSKTLLLEVYGLEGEF